MPWRAKPPPPYGIVVIDWLQSDPLTDAAIFPSVHPSVEFTANGPGVGYTVWPRTSGNRQVKVRFLNPTSTAHTATLTITGAGYATSLGTTSLSVTPTSSQISFPSAGEAEKTLTISGLPNYVAKGDLEITFTLIGNASLSGGVGTTLYQTESSPVGLQNPVWRDVLDDACVWALGQQGDAACRFQTTMSLFYSGVFNYYPNIPVYTRTETPSDSGSINQSYYLRQFFIDRGVVSHLLGDCQDVSNYLSITWKALGVSGDALRYYAYTETSTDLVDFRSQPAVGIGDDPSSNLNFAPFNFQLHQTAFVLGALLVYDAALAHYYDLQGSPHRNPAMAWSYDEYFQKPWTLVAYPGYFSNFVGLAREYVIHSTPFGEEVDYVPFEVFLVGYADFDTD